MPHPVYNCPLMRHIWRKSPKLRRKQIAQNTILASYLETPEDIAIKT